MSRRKRPNKDQRKRVLAVSEGKVTEVEYLEGLYQFLRPKHVRLEVRGVGKDPLKVVEECAKIGEGYDELYCLVDVDEHATLDKAIVEAKRRKINLLISNSCFEIWLLWHYMDCTSGKTPKQLVDTLQNQLGIKGKHIDCNKFNFKDFKIACERAKKVCDECGAGVKGSNPSTALPVLIHRINPER